MRRRPRPRCWGSGPPRVAERQRRAVDVHLADQGAALELRDEGPGCCGSRRRRNATSRSSGVVNSRKRSSPDGGGVGQLREAPASRRSKGSAADLAAADVLPTRRPARAAGAPPPRAGSSSCFPPRCRWPRSRGSRASRGSRRAWLRGTPSAPRAAPAPGRAATRRARRAPSARRSRSAARVDLELVGAQAGSSKSRAKSATSCRGRRAVQVGHPVHLDLEALRRSSAQRPARGRHVVAAAIRASTRPTGSGCRAAPSWRRAGAGAAPPAA